MKLTPPQWFFARRLDRPAVMVIRSLRRRKLRRLRRVPSQAMRVRTRAGINLVVDPRDDRALRLHAAGGAMDRSLRSAWSRLIREIEPTLLIDVGANYGEVALGIPWPTGAQVHLVEANPTLSRLLSQTVAENDLERVYVHACAAGPEDGEVTLQLGKGSSGTSRILHNDAGMTGIDGAIEVPMRSVDSLLGVHKNHRVLMKIDVEGAELGVLRGASDLLDSSEDWAAICEYVHLDARQMRELLAFFTVSLITRGSGDLVRFDPPGLLSGGEVFKDQGQWALKDLVLQAPKRP